MMFDPCEDNRAHRNACAVQIRLAIEDIGVFNDLPRRGNRSHEFAPCLPRCIPA
jgi:hypothetical protein